MKPKHRFVRNVCNRMSAHITHGEQLKKVFIAQEEAVTDHIQGGTWNPVEH